MFKKFMILAGLVAFFFAAPDPAFARGFFETLFGGKKAEPAPPRKPVRKRVPRKVDPKKPIVPHVILAGGTAFEILVIGDSLAANLWQGISTALKPHANVTVSRLTRNRSGLVRDDIYDWKKAIETRIRTKKPDIAVFMLGLNDNQRFQKSGKVGQKRSRPALFSSPLWQEMYSARISDLLRFLTDRGVRVYWTGLPIMKKRSLGEDASYLNSIFGEQAELAGIKYIDIWDAFANEEGVYSRLSPDLKGRVRKMRTKDGIHFTKAGAKKLSHYITREIFADFGASALAQHDRTKDPAALQPGNIIIPTGSFTSAPIYAPNPARRGAQKANPLAQNLEEQLYVRVLIDGDPQPSKPGRADDFSWPK